MKNNNTTSSSMKTALIGFCFLFNQQLVYSQLKATVTGGSCAGSFSLPANGTTNGKNTYLGNFSVAVFGTTVNVQVDLSWNVSNLRWEISGQTGVSGQTDVVFYNTANTMPNPPCHNVGTWVSTSICAGGVFTASSGDCVATIPVELIGFCVKNVGNYNEMTWLTAAEIKNKGFEIERSTDGKSWQTLHFVAAKGSNSTYIFTDKSPLSLSYYRLRQVDFDGQFEYSKVVVAKLEGTKTAVRVFPNPNTEGVIHIQGLTDAATKISITNLFGQIVFQETVAAESAVLNVKNVLSKGVYFVDFKTNNTVFVEKITIE